MAQSMKKRFSITRKSIVTADSQEDAVLLVLQGADVDQSVSAAIESQELYVKELKSDG